MNGTFTPTPLVSVVTPSYNQAAFLEETMRSVLEQDYPAIEYIVIDGGSTDGSVEIIRRYADRLAYWVSEPDRGQADAINKGWARCTGEIIAFLNSDDYYLPGAIRTVVRAFQENPDAGMVCGQARWITDTGVPVQTSRFYIDAEQEGWALLDLENQTSVPQPAAFVRRSAVEKVGMLDPSFHFSLDGEFFIRILGNFRAITIPELIATMRLQEASKSVALGKRFAPEILRMAEKIIASPERYPRSEINPEQLRAAAHILSARSLYVNGAYREAVAHLGRSALHSRVYWPLIARRELPRLLFRMLAGHNLYSRVSSILSRNGASR